MIYLKNDTVNKVALTLNDNYKLGTASEFNFEFKSEWNSLIFTASYSDTSNAPSIFNLLDITLSSTASSTQSNIDDAINLRPGQYLYSVYNGIELLEKGMMVIEAIGYTGSLTQNIYL
jgi:hypothetical protein